MANLKDALVRTGSLLAARNSTNATVIDTDVVIIGGGASGSHAAVRLTDYGQDVIVIEKQSNLVRNPKLLQALITWMRIDP